MTTDAIKNINIIQLSSADMKAVDNLIRDQLYSDIVLIRQIAEYIIQSGGKRLRPLLVVLSARALSYSGTTHHILAAIIEFIHTATLLHDDVVDESPLRRGQKTAHTLFGSAASILVGDFLYTRAFQMMVSCNIPSVMKVLAEATNVIAEGEVLQLINIGNSDIDENTYLQMVQYKTAKLFEASMRLGALVNEADWATENAFAQYGMHLGTAFQIIDDMLDYMGREERLGKRLGEDLGQCKPTLPLIYLLKHGSAVERDLSQRILSRTNQIQLAQILPIIQQSGALEYARCMAQKQSDLAKLALSKLPESVYKTALFSLADMALSRQH